jgi:hypothetical protein
MGGMVIGLLIQTKAIESGILQCKKTHKSTQGII